MASRFSKEQLQEALKGLTDEERAVFAEAVGSKATNPDDLWKDLLVRVEKLEKGGEKKPAAPKKSFLDELRESLGL